MPQKVPRSTGLKSCAMLGEVGDWETEKTDTRKSGGKRVNPEKLKAQKIEAAKNGLWKEVERLNKCIEFNTTAKRSGKLSTERNRRRARASVPSCVTQTIEKVEESVTHPKRRARAKKQKRVKAHKIQR